MNEKIFEQRVNELLALGLVFSQISPFIFYKSTSLLTLDEIRLLDSQDWDIKLTFIKNVISDIEKII
jgi:hypothetical protein